MKNLKSICSVCAVVVVCLTVLFSVCGFADIDLPDTVKRLFGGLNLAAIGTLVFAGMKLRNVKQEAVA